MEYIYMSVGFIIGILMGFIGCYEFATKKILKELESKTGNNVPRGCRESLRLKEKLKPKDKYRTPPAIEDSLPGPKKLSTEFSTMTEFVFSRGPEYQVFTVYFANQFDREQFAAYLYYCQTMPKRFYYLGEL